MNIESRLLRQDMRSARAQGTWCGWWARAARGLRARCVSNRRIAEARIQLGFERVPPRVWARHGALLTAARRQFRY